MSAVGGVSGSPYEDFTDHQLRELARERGLEVDATAERDSLIRALRASDSGAPHAARGERTPSTDIPEPLPTSETGGLRNQISPSTVEGDANVEGSVEGRDPHTEGGAHRRTEQDIAGGDVEPGAGARSRQPEGALGGSESEARDDEDPGDLEGRRDEGRAA